MLEILFLATFQKMTEWHHYVSLADDFLVAFYTLPYSHTESRFFLVGHALELYLKGVLFLHTRDEKKVQTYRHDLYELLTACQIADPAFLPDYVLRKTVLAAHPLSIDCYARLSEEDESHLTAHYDLYRAVVLGADAKYLGTPVKKERRIEVVTDSYPNSYWEKLFSEIARYLKYDGRVAKNLVAGVVYMPPVKTIIDSIFKKET